MPLTDRVLMGPGPSNPYPEAVEALARPMLGHLDPDFVALLDETCDRLRTVFRTTNAMTLPVSGTLLENSRACCGGAGGAGVAVLLPSTENSSTFCGFPSSNTWKSSRLRARTKLPSLSTTRTSSST